MAQIETPSDVSAVTPGRSDIQTFSENDRPTFTSTVTVYVSVARTVTYLKRGWYAAGGAHEYWETTNPEGPPNSGHSLTGITIISQRETS
jgi:hypothetical protein